MASSARALLPLLPLLFAACGTTGDRPATTPTSQDERMAWWRQARFGMFIHWGLYAIPAGKWRDATNHGEWIRDTARIPVQIYDEFQPNWNPVRFDADAWARLAADAGMKYLVVTSKHHDGFCLWNSAHTGWDVGNTPHGRDILRELADACERNGVRFCTYHSIMDWHHPDYLPRRPWEATTRSALGADFARFEQYLHDQVTELVQRYRPAVLWFDGEWENSWSHERGVRLFELCRALDPWMIVNNRVDVHRGGMAGFSGSAEAVGDFATPEQEIPATGLPGVDWESCMTMNGHWGFNAADAKWKSATELVRNLIDIASKGGNYLLNVGPRADGTFPPESVERLQQIGAWLRSNGEAVHGTTASVFDALPWGRCTVRAGGKSRLYLHVFDWPADGKLVVPGLGGTVHRAFLLTAPEQNLAVGPAPGAPGVVVALPAAAPDPIATVVVVEVEGAPIVFRAPAVTADSDRFVHGVDVAVLAPGPAVEVRFTLDGTDPVPGSPRAEAPQRITRTCTLRAATFYGGNRVSDVVARTFTKVDPLPPVQPKPGRQGLRVERFAGDWQRIPDDLATRKPDGATTASGIELPPGTGERVLLSFRGFVHAPVDELYRFALRSDDGSKLWIDGQLVVDNDGLHGTVEQRGAVALGAGLHAIEVAWFNRSGGADLSLQWALPGQPFTPVPADVLVH